MTGGDRIERISDGALALSGQQGCQVSLNELFRRYRGAVVLVARRTIRSRELAEDVAQEAFLQAFAQLRQLQNPDRFAPWLYAITRNIARRAGVRESRYVPAETFELELYARDDSHERICNPLEALLKEESEEEFQSLLQELPGNLLIVLQLYYYEQWDVKQISDFLSEPRTTIKWRLHAGRKRMSKLLNELYQLEEQNDGAK